MAENTLPKDCIVGEMVAGDSNNYGVKYSYVGCHINHSKIPRMSIPERIHFFPPSTPNFHGREQTLIDLTNSVENCQGFESCYERMIIISGLGGIGKSEIAKVLAKKLKDEFAYIFWLNAQSRTSLDSSFQNLLWRLNVKLENEEKTSSQMALQAYRLLEDNFTKSILIFDNAEFLQSESISSFGLEEYLLPNDDLNKPVFIVTTRNNWHSWKLPLKIIPLHELNKEEARVCFLKYLRLEGLEIPLSLSTTIDKLVDIVQGHPLGISIMGNEAARQEDELFGGVEKRISNYLRLLAAQPLEELTGQEMYQWNLQIIFDESLRKFETTETGKDAAKILSILSLLSPDNIYVGLVDGIFSGKLFYPEEMICDRFSVGDSELRVEKALKLLQSNALIRIESVEIKLIFRAGIFDAIRIHRLVQRCAGKSKSLLPQQTHAFNLIRDFFTTTENNFYFQSHLSWILKSLEGTTVPFENLDVLSLIFEFAPTYPSKEERVEVGRSLSSKEWKAEEELVVSLIKIHGELQSEEKSVSKEIKELMLGLPEDLTRREWILQLCWEVLTKRKVFDEEDQRKLLSWFKKCYADCPSISRCFPELLEFMYRWNDWVVDADDGEFVLKVFSNSSERERWRFWWDMSFLGDYKFMGLAKYFFPCSGDTSLFVKSLEFPTEELKIFFLEEWAEYFESCVSLVIGNEEVREKLLAAEEFPRALQEITEFSFEEITREFDDGMVEGISRLLLIWLGLFSAHEDTYRKFGEFVDGFILNLPESTRSQLFNYWTGDWRRYEYFLDLSLKLSRLEFCSAATKSWIQILTTKESDGWDEPSSDESEDEENSGVNRSISEID